MVEEWNTYTKYERYKQAKKKVSLFFYTSMSQMSMLFGFVSGYLSYHLTLIQFSRKKSCILHIFKGVSRHSFLTEVKVTMARSLVIQGPLIGHKYKHTHTRAFSDPFHQLHSQGLNGLGFQQTTLVQSMVGLDIYLFFSSSVLLLFFDSWMFW